MYVEDLPTTGTTTGTLRMFYYVGTNKTYVKDVGTVDYRTGTITMNTIYMTGVPTNTLELIIKTQSNDVVSIRNQLVTIPEANITINMIPDLVSAGDAAGNTNYVFTSSRN